MEYYFLHVHIHVVWTCKYGHGIVSLCRKAIKAYIPSLVGMGIVPDKALGWFPLRSFSTLRSNCVHCTMTGL